MASLFNTRISDTYQGLIKTIDNSAITATLKELTDGSGNATGVYLNNAGDFKVTAILEFGSLKDTGENIIISKFVDAADGVLNNDNDTSIPTTAAIIDYVQGHVTLQDLDFEGDSGNGSVDLDSQLLDIAGTANQITTVASNQTLTISLDSSGVVLPNGSTATTQSQGDNSTKIATTAYVDILDAASDLDFSGDSGTGDVNLNSQTFAITGTTNQIITAASGQGLSLSLPATVHRNLQGDVTGNVTGDLTGNVTATSVLADGVTATTQASSDDSTKVATTAYVKSLNNASDLDFTTDSGSGAVVLNTETLSVIGTANEIETSGSGQQIQIGLPSSINVNVTGNLTGNVTGNVTGDVIGDVTGDLTGNADTATTWQTARDLSLTGQATGTISGVDGSGNVSGSVTLDNNSVTAKVLTGLTSPSASSVLATDTILEGFGKLQSQVNGLAGGLRFMGSWDADTNSPVLSSGGGEAANGTTTGVQANKLIDSSASFTTTVTVGDKVINQVDGQSALVTNIDSNTTLSLDADIMLSGEDYTIDNSPFITQGHYYVVSVGGTTTLNGVSNWTVGDWVIAGANNQWTKLDHSQVDGTGTTGNLTKWSGTQVIADSIVSESGSAITVDGSLSTNTNLSSTGDFAVNTNKFNVAAASGNTSFAGDLAINTNKFTVNATTGDSVIAGNLNFPDDKRIRLGDVNDLQIYYDSTAAAGQGAARINTSRTIIESSFFDVGSSTKTAISVDANNYVILYQNNSEKLRTIGTGVDITGAINADSANISGNLIVDTDTLYVDASNNRVGIGTSSPNSYDVPNLVIEGSTLAGITISESTGGGTGAISFGATSVFDSKARISCDIGPGELFFSTQGSERMRIDSSGNLLVGGTSYQQVGSFSVKGTGEFTSVITSGVGGDYLIGAIGGVSNGHQISIDSSNNQTYKWHNGGTLSMTLDSSGRLGIGTILPVSKLETKDGDIRVTTFNSFSKFKSGRASIPSAEGFNLGGILFEAYSTGTTYTTGAAIESYSDGAAWTSTSTPSYLSFQTVSSGSTSLLERMRIDSSGVLTVGGQTSTRLVTTLTENDKVDINSVDGTSTARNLTFSTGNTERMRIDSSGDSTFYGDVIIENNFPTITLKSTDNTAVAEDIVSSIDFYAGDTSSAGQAINAKISSYATDAFGRLGLQFLTGGNGVPEERMRIDSSGNVGIGTTDIEETLTIAKSDGGDGTIVGLRSDASFSQFEIATKNSQIDWGLETIGARNMYFTTNGSERMRITSGGYLKASNTGSYGSSTTPLHELVQDLNGEWIVQTGHSGSSNPYGVLINWFNAAPNNTTNYFFFATDSSTTAKFYVRANGGIGNFQSNDVDLSDERTKNSITPIDSTWDKIKSIEVVKYKYNEQTTDNFNIGVIAQQVEKVAPELVSNDGFGNLNGQDNDLKSVYNKDLYFTAIKALQEAMDKIETLEAKVATLESQLNT